MNAIRTSEVTEKRKTLNLKVKVKVKLFVGLITHCESKMFVRQW